MKKNFWLIFILGACFATTSLGKVFYHNLLEFISPVEWTHQTTPTTPVSGKVRFYPKNDDKFYILDSAGTETAVGTGEGSGVFNYIIPNGDAEQEDTSGWSCTGNLSMSATSTAPLFDDWSFIVTAAATSADDYCEYDFDLMLGDNAQMLSALVENITALTGYDTGDASLRLYDSDAPGYINNDSEIYASTLGMPHTAGFQAHATNTNYKLRIVSNVNTVWEFKADNIKLQRQGANKGIPATNEKDLNITLSGFGNATVLEAKYYRVGEIMYARGIIDLGTTLPTTTLQFSLDDYTMKYTYNNTLGVALATDTGAKALPGIVRQASSAVLRFYGDTTSDNYWNNVRPFTWAAIDYLEFNFKVAIAGWQAEANMSSTTLNREIFSRYTSNAGTQAFTAVEIIDFEDVDKDKTNAVTTGVAWKFTAQEDGTYSIKAKIIPYFTNAQTSQEAALYLYKNGVQLERLWYEKFQATRTNFYLTMKGSATIPLEANDYIDIRGYSSTSGTATLAGDAAFNSISITKINSGTEKLFEDAKVVAIYETSAPGHNVVTATYTNINYGTKVEDSHNAVTVGVGAWKFTAPMDGTFQIKPTLQWQSYAGWTYNEVSSLFVSKNSLTSSTITADEYFLPTNDASGVAFYVPLLQGSVDIDLLKGEYISIVGYQTSDSTLSLRASTAYNRVSITRIK